MSLEKRMNDQSNGMEVFDLKTPEGCEQLEKFMSFNKHILLPQELEPVLAKIKKIGELGTSEWYEVVYYNGDAWQSYAGSDTFNDGEKVIGWKYCKVLL